MSTKSHVVVVGAGPAGLMAAETMAAAGMGVSVVERMPSAGRKLLMAGRGGLNLTHGEALEGLLERYGPEMRAAVAAFPPASVIAWCEGLGQATFVGSSLRVFPRAMKASPLLRAWLGRLAGLGVRLRTRTRWMGWDGEGLLLERGERLAADAVVLALGGASWPRLGSDGGWVGLLGDVRIAPLRPANCGFRVAWSDAFRRFAGAPLKRIGLGFGGRVVRGEAVITEGGIEGGAVYALSAELREAIAASGPVELLVDLRPDVAQGMLAQRVNGPRGSQSLSNFLRKGAGLAPVGIGLVQEALHAGYPADDLAGLIKAVPVRLEAPSGLARAISTAGGIGWEEVDEHFMLRRRPGCFVAGEMLDWEAPTGGYLLQGCLSTGVAAGRGVLAWLN